MTNRLDRMIARLVTQRACLAFAAEALAAMPGPVLEIGLGKGRTYDFIRTVFVDRDIYAFDREIHAPPDCVPDPDRLFIGEFRRSLAAYEAASRDRAALAHADIGSEDPVVDARLVAWLRRRLPSLVAPGGLIICDRPLLPDGGEQIALPIGVADWPYHIYRMGGTHISEKSAMTGT